MRMKLLRLITVLGWFVFFSNTSKAQNCIPTNINGAVFNLACNQVCSTLVFRIPHLKSSSDYTLVPVPYQPYPYSTVTGSEDLALYSDDKYSRFILLPFTFCFYDTLFSRTVVGSNGLMTFEQAVANCENSWPITQPIPFAGVLNCTNAAIAYYPRASIMAAFSDLDPTAVASPADRKIQWEVVGTAPCRKFVVSYYHIGVFGVPLASCTSPQNTFQIVLHESTGLIEIFFEQKLCASSTNSPGKGIFGLQNWARDKWISAPGKNNAFWTETNTGYRLVPSGGASRFVISELLNMSGTVVSTADTSTTTVGLLDVAFTNYCPPAGNNQYVVRTTFSACDNPATQLISFDTITISRTNSLNATAAATNTACGPPSGTITITVPAGIGTPPYTFVLDGGTPVVGLSPQTFNGVASGPHSVVITDASGGCTSTLPVTVNLINAINATVLPAATSCTGVANGTITVTPTSGTAPYQYSLDGAPPVAGPVPYIFTNVSAGAHIVRVTDAAGCVTNTLNATVVAGPPLTATANPAATSCTGATNGMITVTPNSGAAPFTFSLDGGPSVGSAVPYTFTNVAAGPHTVIVTDGAGCVTNTINVTVAAGIPLTTTVSKTDVLCNGGATGTITIIQPVTGIAPYQYSLNGITWQAGNVFPGLVAGAYTVFYRESSGCQGSQSITVGEPTALTASTVTVPVVCNGQPNGIITVTAAGGISPYQYSINGGAAWQAGNVFNVAAGPYTISIRDVNNCITTRAVTVTQPAALTASSINGLASCNGGNDGVITVSANGGNPGYQYSLDGITFQASNTFTVAPGNYTVTVKDNLSCTTTFNTTVLLGSNFTLTPQTDPTICEGTSTQLALTSNAIQYAWIPATGLSSTTISNPVANPAVTTQYIVTATLGRCSGNDTVIVNVNAAPIPNAGPDGFICYGQTYQLQATGGTVYSWSPNTYLNSSSIPNPISAAGKDITYTLSILSDINGCASLTTDQIRIDVTPPIKVKTFPYDTIGYTGDQFQLLAIPSDSDVINYLWTPATGLSDPKIANPIVTVGATGDVVQYQVITSTIAGCKGEGYVTIRVYKGPDIYVPSGFTPNGDGKNDRFTPFPVGMKSYTYFRVFNRWGQLVFSTTRLNDGWDGKLGGTNQQSGVYVWMIEGLTKDDRVITKRGTVALIR